MTVKPRPVAGTVAFTEGGAPVRIKLMRESADAGPGSTPGAHMNVKLDWDNGMLSGVHIDGLLDAEAEPVRTKGRRVFVAMRKDNQAKLRPDSSAVPAHVEYSDRGAPIRIALDLGNSHPMAPPDGKLVVELDWSADRLIGVSMHGTFPTDGIPTDAPTHRVYRVRHEPNKVALTLDPAVIPAVAEFDEAGLPVMIKLQEATVTAPCAAATDAPTRRVYRVQHEPNKVALTLDPAVIPAVAEFDEAGLPVLIRLHEAARTAPTPLRQDGAAVEVPAAAAWKREDYLYYGRRSRAGTVVERSDIPPYYITGFAKKLDLRADWSAPFNTIAETILASGRTLLGMDRLYTLWQAVRNVAHLTSPIIEFGSGRGGSTALLAEAQRHFAKHGTIYSCDTSTADIRPDPVKDHERFALREDTGVRIHTDDIAAYLRVYPSVQICVGNIAETANNVPGEIAAMHLDVNFYAATRSCLEAFMPRLAPDGLVVVDDYAVTSCPGVKLAVDEFIAASDAFVAMHLLTGQALLHRKGRAA